MIKYPNILRGKIFNYLVPHQENDFAAQCFHDVVSLIFVPVAENFHDDEMGVLRLCHVDDVTFEFVEQSISHILR